MVQNTERGKAILATVLLIAWMLISPVTPIPFDGVAAAAILILRGGRALLSEK